jgi:hypothetical protein
MQLDLGELLDDEEGPTAEALGEQRGLDVLLVFVAVADDHGLGVVEEREHHEQLGLAAGL